MHKLMLAAVAACSIAGVAHAATTPQAAADNQASVPFVDFGGVQDWRVTNAGDLLLQGTAGNYYRAQLMGACPSLGSSMRIGIPGGAMDQLDRFSSIYVGGEPCPLKSLTRIDKSDWDAAQP